MAAPALAPFQDYYKAADRQMRPAEYTAKAVVSATEPKVTLPGPALPRELMSLQAAVWFLSEVLDEGAAAPRRPFTDGKREPWCWPSC
jgi:hypothetical protein